MIQAPRNKLIPGLGMLVVAGAIGLTMLPDKEEERFVAAQWQPPATRADTDTPEEAIRALQAQVQALTQETQRVRQHNQELRADHETRARALEQSRRQEVTDRPDPRVKAAEAAIVRLETRVRELSAAPKPEPERVTLPETGAVVIEPLNARARPRLVTQRSALQPAAPSPSIPTLPRLSVTKSTATKPPEPQPRYTLPVGTTLAGSVAWTGIIGKISINGQVGDPYPWKAVVGRGNLAAVGFRIPGLQGAIVGGYAYADNDNLSCITARVRYFTFVFEDGTVFTDFADSGETGQALKAGQALGYVGNPCLKGQYIGNGQAYLTNKILLGAGSTAGYALAQGETTSAVSPIGGTSITTRDGDLGPFIAGQALAGSVNEVQSYLDARLGESFGAVVVPPNTRIAINLEKAIEIDYDPTGRKVYHPDQSPVHGLGGLD